MRIVLRGRGRIGFWLWFMIPFGILPFGLGIDSDDKSAGLMLFGAAVILFCIYKIVKIWNEG